MSRFGLLFARLLYRRLLGDGEGAVSIIPPASLTLGLSTLLFTLVAQERSVAELTLLLCLTCFGWSALRTFLTAHEPGGDRDRAVLEPLPIPPALLIGVKLAVSGVQLAVGTMNLALPPLMITAWTRGLPAGLSLLCAALAAASFGLAVGQLLRRALEGVIGVQRLSEWEGPLRLMVAIVLFAILFAAPDPTAPLRAHPALGWLPPLSFAVFAATPRGAPLIIAGAGIVLVGVLLAIATRIRPAQHSGSRGVRAAAAGSAWSRFIARRFVRSAELASYEFALANLARDRSFRARVYPLFAFPFAVIVLVAGHPEQPHLVLMALYGVPVYLVLAQTFQQFTESERGALLLEAQPVLDLAAFRLGAEKAFLVALLTPIYATLMVALLLLAVFVPESRNVANAGHAALAVLFSILLAAVTFERQPGLAFSQPDRGIYPADLGGGVFGGLALAVLASVLSVQTAGRPLALAITALGLTIAIRMVFAHKRRRWIGESIARVDPRGVE